MKTTAMRIHGVRDLRVTTFELPEMQEDELLVKVMVDSLCYSTYKVAQKGSAHKKLPENLDVTPIVMGHEFCGVIEKVGEKWKDMFKPGDKFVVQPNIGRPDTYNLGYSFPYVGGDSTYSIIMNEAIEAGCVLPYKGDSFFEAAMAEPLSCVVAGFKANFHLRDRNDYDHTMGVKIGGNMAIIGGTGPMGHMAIDYAIHGDKKPKLLVVAGRTQSKLDRLAQLYPVEEAKENGVELIYFNTSEYDDFSEPMKALTGGKGFDDVFVMVANDKVVNQSEKILGWDGCFNFFAGPIDGGFTAPINFYNIHYNATHYVGTSGSNAQDMIDAVKLIEDKVVSLGKVVTHILGLDNVPETILTLPEIPGGKKICYSQKAFPLCEITDMAQDGSSEFAKGLKAILEKNDGLWTVEAEEYFLEYAPNIENQE